MHSIAEPMARQGLEQSQSRRLGQAGQVGHGYPRGRAWPTARPALGTHPLQLVKQCNEGAHKMERTEQMYTLHTQLDFSKVKVGGAHSPQPPPSQAPSDHSHVPGFPEAFAPRPKGALSRWAVSLGLCRQDGLSWTLGRPCARAWCTTAARGHLLAG